MDLVQADYYIPLGAGYNGGSMTDGPYKGKTVDLSLAVMCARPGSTSVVSSTLSFSQSPKKFLNLGDCDHVKVSGTLVATQVPTQIESYDVSVAGPIYVIKNTRFNRLVPPGGSDTIALKLGGSYNDCPSGYWFFAAGIRWIGDVCVCISGYPDLLGSSMYVGSYSIFAQENVFSDSSYVERHTTIQTYRRTSLYTVDEIFSLYFAQVLVNLSEARWYPSSYQYAIRGYDGPKRSPNFSGISMDNLFPRSSRNGDWGELARRAYNSVSFFQGNGIALTSDLVGLKAAAESTGALISKLIGGGAAISVIAKLFLAFHYGWKLLVSDLKSLNSSMKKYSSLHKRYSKCSANSSWSEGNRKYTNYYHCYYIRDGQVTSYLDQIIEMFDLDLSLENIWDLVPYSFCVDWFINLSTLLESLDSYYAITQRHSIICSGRTIKSSAFYTPASAGFSGWSGNVTLSYYQRRYTESIIYPSLLLDTTIQPLQHIVEGGALIVSKR